MKRGHSNVCRLDKVEPYPTNPERACIPIEGGADVYTLKELPPLALGHNEWITIGLRMKWMTEMQGGWFVSNP